MSVIAGAQRKSGTGAVVSTAYFNRRIRAGYRFYLVGREIIRHEH